MKRYTVERINYSTCGKRTYEYAVIDKFDHCHKIKGGFDTVWSALLWYSQTGFSILDLEEVNYNM